MNYANYKITYTYQSYKTSRYDGSKITKTTEAVLSYDDNKNEPTSKVNTYRLSGFERATIEVIKTEYLSDLGEYLIDLDIERNDLSIYRHTETFLNEFNTVDEFKDVDLDDVEDTLLERGYIEAAADNTYNWCADYSDDIYFKVFTKGESPDYIYDDSAIVIARVHRGIDARAGYSDYGVYSNAGYDAICEQLHLRSYIQVWTTDKEGNEVDSYDGDGALSHLLDDYTLTKDSTPDDIKVKNKDGEILEVRFY